MNIRLFLLSLISCVCISATAKGLVDTSADHGLMVRQIPGSESDAIAFFKGLPVECDTIYATIFRPANCPRCDGFINIINSHIKENTEKETVLIAVYPDSMAAKAYIDKYDLKADHYMYDTDEKFNDFLSFSSGCLHVGYILKFNIATGELIVGSNADNVSPAFVKELDTYSTRKPAYRFPSGSIEHKPITEDTFGHLKRGKQYRLNGSNRPAIMSELLYQPLFENNNILWNDKLGETVYNFEVSDSTMRFKGAFDVDSVQAATFADVPAERYRQMKDANMLKNIPMQPFAIDSDKIGIPYSLPDLWIGDNNGMNYRNKPCYIVHSLSDSSYSELIPLNFDYTDDFFYHHFYLKNIGDEIVAGVQRLTWPILYDKEEYMHNPENNPFQDEFYEYPQPTLATFRKSDGKVSLHFGELPSFAKKAKTGYMFAEMIFDASGDEAVYAKSYDGTIYVSPATSLDCPDCRKEYHVFTLDVNEFQIPDSTDYYSYNCTALAEPLLNRKIVDLKADHDYIHCVYRTCIDAFERPDIEEYRYAIIDRESGFCKTLAYPGKENGEHRMGYGLRRTADGTIQPYFISRLDDSWSVTLLDE